MEAPGWLGVGIEISRFWVGQTRSQDINRVGGVCRYVCGSYLGKRAHFIGGGGGPFTEKLKNKQTKDPQNIDKNIKHRRKQITQITKTEEASRSDHLATGLYILELG